MNNHLITYDQLITWYGFDPETVKPYQVKLCLDRNNVKYHTGFKGRPCVTLEALNHASGIPVLNEIEPEQGDKFEVLPLG